MGGHVDVDSNRRITTARLSGEAPVFSVGLDYGFERNEEPTELEVLLAAGQPLKATILPLPVNYLAKDFYPTTPLLLLLPL